MGPVTRGVEGVFTYYIPGINQTLAVMFSVPYINTNYNNRVDIMLYGGKEEANNQLWEKMYKYNPKKFKGMASFMKRTWNQPLGKKGSVQNSLWPPPVKRPFK